MRSTDLACTVATLQKALDRAHERIREQEQINAAMNERYAQALAESRNLIERAPEYEHVYRKLVQAAKASGQMDETRAWQHTIPDAELLVLPGDSYHVAASHAVQCAQAALAFIARRDPAT